MCLCVRTDKVAGKQVPHLFIYLFIQGEKVSCCLAPSPGSQELGCIRVLLNLYTTQISKDKALVHYNSVPFKKGFLEPAPFWTMCLHNNLQECS